MNNKIEPFTGPLASCPKCGNGSALPDRLPPLPPRDFAAPSPRFQAAGFHPSNLRVHYCPGGKEPEENLAEPLTELFGKIIAAADKFQSLTVKKINICAGITEDHLHVTCVDCNYEWLTQTKEQAANNPFMGV